jgi:hypothetical protein
MLRPNKHSNPDQTVIGVATLVVKRLGGAKVESFDSLEEYVEMKIKDGKYLLLPALNLLYVLGVIDYHKKQDMFEFIGAGQ